MAIDWRSQLAQGQVIPACPLMLDSDGEWNQRYQRAIVRYYIDSGAGGLAVGVHSTQFAIRDPAYNLFEPILRLVAETLDEKQTTDASPFVRIAGLCGETTQAISEAEFALSCGYHAGLLSLSAVATLAEVDIVEHCRQVARHIPIIGFYLQPAVGGRVLTESFWRRFVEIDQVLAIKIAPFNRYQTIDVIRAVMQSGRDDIALYTGNDDNIIVDLLTRFEFSGQTRHIAGGLLGQWGVWTSQAVKMLGEIQAIREHSQLPAQWLTRNIALTDASAAIFDAANGFSGCIPGIMEILRRQGLAPSNRCLNPNEVLSPGQAEELDRVSQAYPELTDDLFVRENLSRWLEM